jgi:hypothetical protein
VKWSCTISIYYLEACLEEMRKLMIYKMNGRPGKTRTQISRVQRTSDVTSNSLLIPSFITCMKIFDENRKV